MKKTNRLIDFFAVIGPDSQFTVNDPDIEKGNYSSPTCGLISPQKKV